MQTSEQKTQVLTQMVGQFQSRHKRKPLRIVVTPMALLVLAVKRSVFKDWEGVPVLVKAFAPSDATDQMNDVRSLGVFVQPNGTVAELRCCDLKI